MPNNNLPPNYHPVLTRDEVEDAVTIDPVLLAQEEAEQEFLIALQADEEMPSSDDEIPPSDDDDDVTWSSSEAEHDEDVSDYEILQSPGASVTPVFSPSVALSTPNSPNDSWSDHSTPTSSHQGFYNVRRRLLFESDDEDLQLQLVF